MRTLECMGGPLDGTRVKVDPRIRVHVLRAPAPVPDVAIPPSEQLPLHHHDNTALYRIVWSKLRNRQELEFAE